MIVSDSIYKIYPDIQPGDTLHLSILDGRTEDWVVGGIFRFTDQVEGVFGYAAFDTLARITNTIDQAASYRIMTNDNTREEEEATARRIDARLRGLGFLVSQVESGRAKTDTYVRKNTGRIAVRCLMPVSSRLVKTLAGAHGQFDHPVEFLGRQVLKIIIYRIDLFSVQVDFIMKVGCG